VTTDAPMPISAAVAAFFPHGGVTKATLLAAIRAGTLGFEKVGRAYLVTEADIQAWRAKCREEAKGRVSTSTKEKAASQSMSSATDRAALAQAAAGR
jgi:excisionase family DNA binding protein